MIEPTPEQILSINTTSLTSPVKKRSTGWTIFWLLSIPPVGMWMGWKSDWSKRSKIIVEIVGIVLTLLYIFLTVETELISSQLANTSLGV